MPTRRLHIKILHSEPCTEAWGTMHGDSKSRHCDSCNKQVHNFAGMTACEIEQLLIEKNGRLCARIVERADGSILTTDAKTQPSLAAGFVLATSLTMGVAAAAQEAETPKTARLSGTVLSPDGSTPMKDIPVDLVLEKRSVTTVRTDQNGNFTLVAEPGQYDIVISRNLFQKSRIPNASLHAGDQIVPPLRVGFDQHTTVETVTLGVVSATYRYPISYLFKHPLRYLKNIRHQL